MNKAISIIRISILVALSCIAIILIFGKEQDANLLTWTFSLIIHKSVGIGIIVLIVRLYKRWSKIDPWLIAYYKMCDEVMEKPNPMYLDNDKEA